MLITRARTRLCANGNVAATQWPVTACRQWLLCFNFIARCQKNRSDECCSKRIIYFFPLQIHLSIWFVALFLWRIRSTVDYLLCLHIFYTISTHFVICMRLRSARVTFNFRDFCLAVWQSVVGWQRFLVMIFCAHSRRRTNNQQKNPLCNNSCDESVNRNSFWHDVDMKTMTRACVWALCSLPNEI